jgi:hypothetical protein
VARCYLRLLQEFNQLVRSAGLLQVYQVFCRELYRVSVAPDESLNGGFGDVSVEEVQDDIHVKRLGERNSSKQEEQDYRQDEKPFHSGPILRFFAGVWQALLLPACFPSVSRVPGGNWRGCLWKVGILGNSSAGSVEVGRSVVLASRRISVLRLVFRLRPGPPPDRRFPGPCLSQ